jgi:HlyD family secretion protein
MKTLITILTLAVGAFLAGVFLGPRWTKGEWHTSLKPPYSDAALADQAEPSTSGRDRPAHSSVHALGRVEPDGGLYLVSAPTGFRIDRVLVDVGDPVKKGHALAFVEGYSEREAQIGLIELQLAEARDQVQAEEEYETILDDESKVEKTSFALLEAPELKVQETNIEVLAEKSKSSKHDYENLLALQKDRRATVSAQDLERQHLVMRQDDATLRNARAQLEKFKAGRETESAKLEIALKKGKNAAKRTRLAVPVKSLEKQLELARERLRQSIIVAPADGRVLAVSAKAGELPGPKPVIQLGNTSRMYVVAEVDEDEIYLLEKGQPATISNHTWKRPYSGKVESWALMVAKNDVLGLDPAAAAYARVVEVKILVQEPDEQLRDRTHMQVTVNIDVRPKSGANQAAGAAVSTP